MSLTVGYVIDNNTHAAKWNSCFNWMFKERNETITVTQLRTSQAVSLSVFAGVPLSTVTAGLVQSPKLYLTGLCIGFLGGIVYRIGREVCCSPTVSYFEDWQDWMEHYAPMRSIVKAGMATLGSGGAVGNMAVGIFIRDDSVAICEGAIMGGIVGQELAGVVSHLASPKYRDNNVPSETSHLIKSVEV